MHSVLVNGINTSSDNRGMVLLTHQASKSRRTGILGQFMILNMAYRVIALSSILGAFIFGALLHSGIQYVENGAKIEMLISLPISALKEIKVSDI